MRKRIASSAMTFALEDQLLVQCSRVQLREEAIANAAHLLRQNLDWDYILEVAIRHAVAPLFLYGLNQVSQAVELARVVPTSVLEALQTLYRGNQSAYE